MRSEGHICHYVWKSSARAHQRFDHPQYSCTVPKKEESSTKLLESCTGINDVAPPRQYIKGVAVIGHACRAGSSRHAQTMKRLNAQAYIRINGRCQGKKACRCFSVNNGTWISPAVCAPRERGCAFLVEANNPYSSKGPLSNEGRGQAGELSFHGKSLKAVQSSQSVVIGTSHSVHLTPRWS